MSERKLDNGNACETCGQPALLLGFSAGSLDEEDRARVEHAVERCSLCRARIAENEALRLATLSSPPSPVPWSAEALVELSERPLDDEAVTSLSQSDREILEVLHKVNRDLQTEDAGAGWLDWARRALDAVTPEPGAGFAAWLRSPALAYLVVLALALPAYRGLVGDAGSEMAPAVLPTPVGIDGPDRSEGETTVQQQGTYTVVTVFVPIEEGYRYRLEIVDASGRRHFVQDDAESFDGYGTFAVLLPARSLPAGEYELLIEERSDAEAPAEVFQFPFRVER